MTATAKVRALPERLTDLIRAARSSLLWALLARQRGWVRAMLMLFVAVTVLTINVSQLTAGMIDRAMVDQVAPLGPFVSRIVFVAALVMIVQFTMAQVASRVTYQIEFDLRVWLYTRIQAAEATVLDRVAGGQLVTRALTDLQLVERILGIAPVILGLLPLQIGLTFFLFILSPPMAVLAVAMFPINLMILLRFRERLWGLSWADLNERAEVMTAIDEPVRGIRVVKAFGREDEERAKVAAVALRAYRFAMTRVRLLARYDIALKFIPYALNAVVLAIGAHLVAADRLTLGVFLIAFQLTQLMTSLATIIAELASQWQYLRSAQGRLMDMLALGVRSGAALGRLPEVATGLRLEGVGVEFDGRPILDAFDLTVAPGELVVVTGAPSSGKTTLAAVASGLLPVSDGGVILDDVDVREVDPADVRQAVRIVSEESILFAASLRENLQMGATHPAGDAALVRALWAAGGDDLLDAIEGGLDGQIGDRGLTLSGGQRQRLALARSLVEAPRVLVLDDALAAVNPSLEIEILGRIRQHAPATAVLCITRRPSLRSAADRVVELPPPSGAAAAHVAGSLLDEPVGVRDDHLASVLGNLKLTGESPSVDEKTVLADRKPAIREIGRVFGGLIFLAGLALIVQTLGHLAPSALFGSIADVVDSGTDAADARAVTLVFVGLVFALASFLFRVLAQRFNQGLLYLLRRRMFHRLTRLGIDYYDRELPGQVAARVVYDLDQLNEFLQLRGFRMLVHLVEIVVALGVIVAISPRVFPVVLVMLLLMALITAIQFPIAMRAFGWARDELGRVTAKFEEDLTGRSEIRKLGAEELQLQKFVSASWQRRRARWWSMSVSNAYGAVLQFIGTAGAAFVLFRAGNLVLAGTLSIGTALTLRLLSTAATQPLGEVGAEYRDFLDVRVSWKRLCEPFDVPILPVQRPDATACPALAGAIAFDGVSFTYPHTGQRVLHDVTFQLEPGTVTALVGYTGAGKSSIAKLLSRMYDPDSGSVLVDGVDLRALDLTTYRQHLGIVPQDAFLFRGSVASNIAYGRPEASLVDIEAAAWAVGAGELLSSLPDGFEHRVEEEARNLTAAHRQLIALARAWLAAPDVLILDEATSCLDARLEEHVIESLAASGSTTLLITHREQVAARTDRIVVLEGGRVVEEGTAAAVMAGSGPFHRLWSSDDRVGRKRPSKRAKASTNGHRRSVKEKA